MVINRFGGLSRGSLLNEITIEVLLREGNGNITVGRKLKLTRNWSQHIRYKNLN